MLWWFSPRKLPFEILFTPDNVTVMNNHVVHWGKQIRLKHKGVKLHINGKFAQVTLQHNVTFTVMRHKTPPKNRAFKPDYLGFFLEHSKGLSDGAHGLIGEFICAFESSDVVNSEYFQREWFCPELQAIKYIKSCHHGKQLSLQSLRQRLNSHTS